MFIVEISKLAKLDHSRGVYVLHFIKILISRILHYKLDSIANCFHFKRRYWDSLSGKPSNFFKVK